MKKAYVKPVMTSEEFIPSIFCNACGTQEIYNVIPYCAIPGNGNKIKDSYPSGGTAGSDSAYTWDGEYYPSASGSNTGRTHGSCANNTGKLGAIYQNGTGIEPNKQPIYGVQIGSINKGGENGSYSTNIGDLTSWNNLEVGKWYNAIWQSNDDAYNYTHYGAVYIDGKSTSFS